MDFIPIFWFISRIISGRTELSATRVQKNICDLILFESAALFDSIEAENWKIQEKKAKWHFAFHIKLCGMTRVSQLRTKKKQLIATAPSTELVLYEYILYFYFYCVFQY